MNNLFFYPLTANSWTGAFVKSSKWNPTDAFLYRVMDSYQVAAKEFGGSGNSMWTSIATRQRDIHQALMSDNSVILRRILSSPERSYLYYGVDNLFPDHIDEMRRSPADLKVHAALLADHILRLSEALAVQRILRPTGAQGDFGPGPIDTEELLEKLEQRLGVSLNFPNPFSGEFGLPTSRGLISYRSLLAIYQAWRLKALLANSVLEIGAGMGRTAVFANLLGVKDYVVVDLPMTIVGQACFIAAVLGESAVHMIGDQTTAKEVIRLVPPSRLSSVSTRYDIILNVNSMTEMDIKDARVYADFIKANTNQFISINHETNEFCVRDLFNNDEIQIQRFPYWMRTGYVEEIFKFSD
jgi:hypothetical protein